jgi:transcriptional accessory protein Tex/SPT6
MFVNLNSDFSLCLSGLKKLAEEFGVPEAQMKLISEGLQKPPEHDLRSQISEPLFHRGITSLEDIHTGAVLTGDILISFVSEGSIC